MLYALEIIYTILLSLSPFPTRLRDVIILISVQNKDLPIDTREHDLFYTEYTPQWSLGLGPGSIDWKVSKTCMTWAHSSREAPRVVSGRKARAHPEWSIP